MSNRVTHYQYRHDRARRTLRGIDEQIAKAQRAVDGHALWSNAIATSSDRRDQVGEPDTGAKTRALAGATRSKRT
jgi:hypothetical protein